MQNTALFLDFDGVICDSVAECFVSSWIAYTRLSGRQPDRVGLVHRSTFASYRPFIRRGADYLLLQDCIARGIPLTCQEDFDRQERSRGKDGMDTYHEVFYRAREELLSKDRQYWLGLNSLYPGIRKALESLRGTAFIISTKKSSFVCEILASQGLDWEQSLILYSGTKRKADMITSAARDAGYGRACFVDDQIDHLYGLAASSIDGYLASWGYVKKEWLSQSEVPVLDLQEFVALLGRFA